MTNAARLRSTTRISVTVAAALLVSLAPFTEARAQGNIDPDAARILQAMSRYMTSLKTFTATFSIDSEVIDTTGQKLDFNSTGEIVAQRPNGLYSHRTDAATDGELYFDGKSVTLVSRSLDAYAQISGPATIEQAIDAVRSRTDIDLPAADLLYPDPASGLLTDVESGTYLGRDNVDGIPCDHLAFRAKKVDWQLWVRTDTPVPIKYVITTKWTTGAPQYSIHLSNWNIHPRIDPKRFEFVPPKGAKRYEPESIQVNELGEVSGMEHP